MRLSAAPLALVCGFGVACGPQATDPALRVEVTWDSHVTARCVKVRVVQSDGGARETGGILRLAGQSRLVVAVYRDGTDATAAVSARGFGPDCATEPEPPEASSEVLGEYGYPDPGLVELRLLVLGPLDGGPPDGGPADGGPLDAGPPDAGPSDAGPPDAGPPDAGQPCSSGVPISCAGAVPACQQRFACGDGTCVVRPLAAGAACADGLVCTGLDTCDGDGGCLGGPQTCTSPPGNACLAATCAEPGGCAVVPDPLGTCTDGNACTDNDACLADGGCAGAPLGCPTPGVCQTSGSCDAGACIYGVRVGSCDGGTCNGLGQCVPTSTILFPYLPSNFAEGQLPALSPVGHTITCAATLDTQTADGGLAFTSVCALVAPSLTIILQDGGGPSAALLYTADFTVTAAGSFTVLGARPLIIVALGNVVLGGPVVTRAGIDRQCAAPAGVGSTTVAGGGGAGFGAIGSGGGAFVVGAGGAGQASSGNQTLVPLRGGCSGGAGGASTAGGAGGGALQISATKVVTISAALSAPGGAGLGAPTTRRGAGGGGSGGGLLLEALQVTVGATGSVTANGGSGGEGSDTSAGANGQPGTTTLANASGGTGSSSCGGAGGRGGARNGLPASGSRPGSSSACRSAGGGGGGAGVGRIRVNALNGCSLAGTVSPQPTGCL